MRLEYVALCDWCGARVVLKDTALLKNNPGARLHMLSPSPEAAQTDTHSSSCLSSGKSTTKHCQL